MVTCSNSLLAAVCGEESGITWCHMTTGRTHPSYGCGIVTHSCLLLSLQLLESVRERGGRRQGLSLQPTNGVLQSVLLCRRGADLLQQLSLPHLMSHECHMIINTYNIVHGLLFPWYVDDVIPAVPPLSSQCLSCCQTHSAVSSASLPA